MNEIMIQFYALAVTTGRFNVEMVPIWYRKEVEKLIAVV